MRNLFLCAAVSGIPEAPWNETVALHSHYEFTKEGTKTLYDVYDAKNSNYVKRLTRPKLSSSVSENMTLSIPVA